MHKSEARTTEYTQLPISGVHPIMMEKSVLAGEGGGASPPPFSLFFAVYVPAERANTLFYFISTLYVLCGKNSNRSDTTVATGGTPGKTQTVKKHHKSQGRQHGKQTTAGAVMAARHATTGATAETSATAEQTVTPETIALALAATAA